MNAAPLVGQSMRLSCKCCGGVAHAFGVVDFHKNCEQRRRQVLEPSGVMIGYHRCGSCGFLFTTDFDAFSRDDLRQHIYNESYVLVDPDYTEERPRNMATMLCQRFPDVRPTRVLDYGGGSGTLAGLLREAGFPCVETYDPFVPQFDARPSGRFDCIVCFEVMEHATRPAELISGIAELLADPGIVIFSTLLQPSDIVNQGLEWWYVGPRNGHVSMHTAASLRALAEPHGLMFGSFNESLHALLRGCPPFARHLLA